MQVMRTLAICTYMHTYMYTHVHAGHANSRYMYIHTCIHTHTYMQVMRILASGGNAQSGGTFGVSPAKGASSPLAGAKLAPREYVCVYVPIYLCTNMYT